MIAAEDLSRRFENLLASFSHVEVAQRSNGDGVARLRNLLANYAAAASMVSAPAWHEASADALLAEFRIACENWRRDEEKAASEFNILSVFELESREDRHSMALAWLLCGDHRHLGTHAQGNLGFRLFLEEIGLPPELAAIPYRVSREVSGDQSRIDIEVARRGQFLMHIEIKVRSLEGTLQTLREWDDLQRRARAMDISLDVPGSVVIGYYLTPDGATPRAPGFRPLRWTQVARVFDQFAEHAQPPEVRLFARHFARGLRRFVIRSDSSSELGP